MHITLPSLALLVYALSTAQCAVSIPIPSSGSASNAAPRPKSLQAQLRDERLEATKRGSLANALAPPLRATLPSTSQPQAPLPLAQPPSASSAHQQQAESHTHATHPPPPSAHLQPAQSLYATQPPPLSAVPLSGVSSRPSRSRSRSPSPGQVAPLEGISKKRSKPNSARAPPMGGTLGVIEEGKYRELGSKQPSSPPPKMGGALGVIEKGKYRKLGSKQPPPPKMSGTSSSATLPPSPLPQSAAPSVDPQPGSSSRGQKVQCEEPGCGSMLKDHDSLRKHMRYVHGDEEYPCPNCPGKTYTTPTSLRRHVSNSKCWQRHVPVLNAQGSQASEMM